MATSAASTAADVEPVFAAYEAFLAEALPRAEAIQAAPPRAAAAARPLPGRGAARAVPRAVGSASGSTSTMRGSTNRCIPSAAARPTDVRITTFYDERDVAKALLGVLHETGHALYEARPARGLARASRSARRRAWRRMNRSR